ELHCPRSVRGASIQFAVNEVCAAPEEQTDRRGDDQRVTQIRPGKFVSARVVKTERKNANHSAVAGHAAFPHPQDRERLTQHFRFIKEDVTNSPAEQHAKERSPGNEIADSLRLQVAVAALGEQANDEVGGNKREDVSKRSEERRVGKECRGRVLQEQ